MTKCPYCESTSIANILWGLPNFSPVLEKKVQEKKIVFGGIFLALGFLTRFVAIQLIGLLAVATFYIHLKNGFLWVCRRQNILA